MEKVLQDYICLVNFTKADGSIRKMKCTLIESYLPLRENDNKNRKENTDVLSVWDLDNNGWRSFRIDSVNELYRQQDGSWLKAERYLMPDGAWWKF